MSKEDKNLGQLTNKLRHQLLVCKTLVLLFRKLLQPLTPILLEYRFHLNILALRVHGKFLNLLWKRSKEVLISMLF